MPTTLRLFLLLMLGLFGLQYGIYAYDVPIVFVSEAGHAATTNAESQTTSAAEPVAQAMFRYDVAVLARSEEKSGMAGNGILLAKFVEFLAAKTAAGLRSAEQAGITAAEAQRIQNAANRLGKPINVVGSRAKGTAGVNSDWDYVVTGANRSDLNKIKNSLPGAPNRLDGTPRNLEVFKGELDPNLPHVPFSPQP